MSFGRVTTLLVLSRFLGYALALLNSVILARLWGPERLGEYAYAMGVAALFGMLPNLGISSVVTRAMAQNPSEAHGIVAAARRAQGLLAVLVCLLIIGFAALLPMQPVPLLHVGLAGIQLAIGTLSWPYLAVLGGHGRYDLLAWSEFFAGVTLTLLLVIAVLGWGTVVMVLAAQIVTALGCVLIARLAAGPFLSALPAPPVSLSALLRQAFPFGAGAAVQGIYGRVDVMLLGQMGTTVAVGLYNAAYKPITLAAYFGGTVAGALFPFVAQTPNRLPGMYAPTLRGLALTGPALGLLLTGLAPPMLTFFYGSAFSVAAPIVAILAWSVVAKWLYAPISVALQATGRERAWAILLAWGLFLNVVLNLYAIPRWGAIGAAAVMLATECAVFVGVLALAQRQPELLAPLKDIRPVLPVSVLAAGMLWLSAGWGAMSATLISLMVYGALLIIFGGIELEAVMGWIRQTALECWRNPVQDKG